MSKLRKKKMVVEAAFSPTREIIEAIRESPTVPGWVPGEAEWAPYMMGIDVRGGDVRFATVVFYKHMLAELGFSDLNGLRKAIIELGGKGFIEEFGRERVWRALVCPNLDNPFGPEAKPSLSMRNAEPVTMYNPEVSYEGVLKHEADPDWLWHYNLTMEALERGHYEIFMDFSTGTGGPTCEFILTAKPKVVALGAYTIPELLLTALRVENLRDKLTEWLYNFEWDITLVDIYEEDSWIRLRDLNGGLSSPLRLDLVLTGNTADYRVVPNAMRRLPWILTHLPFVKRSKPLNTGRDTRVTDSDVERMKHRWPEVTSHQISRGDVHFLHLKVANTSSKRAVLCAFSQLQLVQTREGFTSFMQNVESLFAT